jgi:hypothetical protein
MKIQYLIMASVLSIPLWIPFANAADQKFSGRIVFIDPKERILIVQNKNEEETFHPSASSHFTIGGEEKLFAELQKGEEVTVTYKAHVR